MFRKKEKEKISTRPKIEEKPSAFFKIVYFLLLIAFFGVTVYVLIFSNFLQVNNINIQGTSELKYEDVYGKLEASISGKYFVFIPKDNFIIISSKRIKKDLSEEFRKIRSVEVKKTFPDRIDVKIEERKALIVWCAGSSCYIIDEQGYAYTEANFESEEIRQNNLIKITDLSGKSLELGEKILEPEYVNFIFNIRDVIERETGIGISDEYQTQFRISGEIHIKTSDGWYVYLSSDLPLDQSARTLKAFLEKEIPNELRPELEYVDLRVENKVFYKIKGTENEEEDKEESEDGGKNKKDKKKVE